MTAFAGTPRWNRKYIHTLLWVCCGTVLLFQATGNIFVACGTVLQFQFSLFRMPFFAGLAIVLNMLPYIPALFFILGAKQCSRWIDSLVMKSSKRT
jgi:hypothetical protein